ncbi:phosphoribosylglycinamide formyltransferase [Sulfurospirillum arcachonense]|uniref:phosphoribosylglycinamide formyltransferase n=1 Tax=Sulfurospirillum arcachonense TaxID=57666 RepID=UPI00046A4560|nr:phosphoribosylglycinamide formyltransferase [Sulfurospirillum arcachonense]
MVIKKIAVLFSGSGTNLEKILKNIHGKTFSTCKIEVACCICNKKDAQGIEKAKKYGLETTLIEHTNFPDRESFDKELVRVIKQSGAELVVLAGFMRFLTPYFTQNVKAINLHPSLLPLFKGAKAIEESYNSPMKVGGISVHYVNEELDGGEIIAQECFKKEEGMSLEEFEKKIHTLEYELLPKTIIDILDR